MRRSPIPRWVWISAGALVLVVVAVVLVLALPGGDEPVAYCSGEDVSQTQDASAKAFNRSPDRGSAHATFKPLAEKANEQRTQYLESMADGECDVLYLDVIYTPEFASRNLLRDMSSYLTEDLASTFDSRMMQTVEYGGKRWGVPKQLDGGVLYYRDDRVRDVPQTWRSLIAAAVPRLGDDQPGLRLQLDAYEGLTVIFLELAYAAGAQDIVSDGTARIYQPGTIKALRLLQSAFRRRAIPPSVTRLAEGGSLYLFSAGRTTFLRAWPYVEHRVKKLANTTNRTGPVRRATAEHMQVAPLPPWTPGTGSVGILGGHNLVIPRTAKNPEGAMRLIKFLTSPEQIESDARNGSLVPVITAVADRVTTPALSAVQDEDLRLRPPLTCYWRVSRAIYTSLRRVLRTVRSEKTLKRELIELQDDVQRELNSSCA